jgi:flagellar basal-body rod protein FlgG
MIAGIQGLISGMQGQWLRHEVITNNLANATSAGFKRDDIVILPDPPAPPGGLGGDPSLAAPSTLQWTDFSQGDIQQTGRNLDVAIEGKGFLAVQTSRGERYTRAGALNVNADGYLVAAGGNLVLGNGGPIQVRSSRVTVSADGQVSDDGRVVGTLKVVDFPRPYRLSKEGGGLFAPADVSAVPGPAQNYQVVGGALENSNVKPIETMVSLIDILRKYEALQRTAQAVDDANRQSTSEIGKV